ncbi:hypothetical protein QOZ80_7AG0572040 [Eleusine coracana subsp. coracana]|nr:hypothetical protein QOZ80_7AG0571800 [Eleusine coracana subsp. coracana]KAK3127353.1 hypothetical protein QOZ80_7AG0572040 [Eleusine coracana subsp. coracana]
MASPAAALTDDIVAEILLRLPDPADLVRASAACVPYRRLATDRAFLRRYRALHPPPLLGFLDHNGFHPALSPHAAAPVARAVSLAADFSFSFLPSPADRWIVRDARGGRVLLDRAPEDDGGEGSPVSTEVAVCDPLHRRCVVLPPIPDDLAASVEHPVRVEFDRWCEAFLVPRADDGTDAGDETSFEVIWMAQCKAKLVAFAFSSATGQWRAVASLLWRDLRSGAGPVRPVIYGRQYAHGCFYWTMDWHWPNKLLVLDTRRMAFSVADLPPDCKRRRIAIVEAGEGGVGMFTLRDHVADGEVSLHYTVRQDGSSHWQMEKIIPLDPAFRHYIRGATERYVLLLRFPEDLSSSGVHVSSSEEGIDLECFSLDVKTLQLEKVCELKHHIIRAHIYTNFLPTLSSPTI